MTQCEHCGAPSTPDEEATPTPAAARVLAFVQAYRDREDGGATLETSIADMMTDLMHLADCLAEDEQDDWLPKDERRGHSALDRAKHFYNEEIFDEPYKSAHKTELGGSR